MKHQATARVNEGSLLKDGCDEMARTMASNLFNFFILSNHPAERILSENASLCGPGGNYRN